MNAREARAARVTQSLRRHLASLLEEELMRLPGVPVVTLQHVELNRDLSVARIYISVLGSDEKREAGLVDHLNKRSGKFRGPLGRLTGLSRAPELRFVCDHSLDFHARLHDILQEDDARRVASEPTE